MEAELRPTKTKPINSLFSMTRSTAWMQLVAQVWRTKQGIFGYQPKQCLDLKTAWLLVDVTCFPLDILEDHLLCTKMKKGRVVSRFFNGHSKAKYNGAVRFLMNAPLQSSDNLTSYIWFTNGLFQSQTIDTLPVTINQIFSLNLRAVTRRDVTTCRMDTCKPHLHWVNLISALRALHIWNFSASPEEFQQLLDCRTLHFKLWNIHCLNLS